MRQEARKARKNEIEQAALTLLVQKGYSATTMAAVAKAAGASFETLYKWYGDKHGLFRAIVEANTAALREMLAISTTSVTDPLATLEEFGPKLISVLTSDAVVALNRAAAADPSGDLGKIIAEAGRGAITPQLNALFEHAKTCGKLVLDNPADATEIYLGLLLGDLQIRRVVGRLPPPDATEISRRSERALDALALLWSLNLAPQQRRQ